MTTLIVHADERMQLGPMEDQEIWEAKPEILIITYPLQNEEWVRMLEYSWEDGHPHLIGEYTNDEMYEEIRRECRRINHMEEG